VIYFDTETALIGPGLLAPPLTCLQYAVDEGPVGVAVEGVDPIVDLCRALLAAEVCGHNVAYDMLVLGREHSELLPLIFQAYDENRVHDTLVREKLLHIENGTLRSGLRLSLAVLAKKYGGEKNADDPWRMRYEELRGIPFEEWPFEARIYAQHDIDATRLVFLKQAARSGDEKGLVSPDEHRQARAAFAFHLVGAAGVWTDQEAVKKYIHQVHEELKREEVVLKSWGLVREDGTKDTAAAIERMQYVVETEDLRYTETGCICMDEEACQDSLDPIMVAYQRYGSRRTLLSRLASLEKPLINPQFDSLIATGRSSCRKQSSAVDAYQVQNTRREPGERECFVPEPGNVFIACDFDSFELCSLGQTCIDTVGFSHLADKLNGGLDPHLFMAAQILEISYEEALERKKEGDEEVLDTRQLSKAADFGFPGGLGPKGFRRFAKGHGVHISEEGSKGLKKDWHNTWLEMVEYFGYISDHTWVERQTKKGEQKVTGIRQLRSHRIRGGIPYTVACNSYFQGLAADAAKDALYEVVKACYQGELQGWRCWNFVHDEIIIEGPQEDGDRAAKVLQRIMIDTAQPWMPDVKLGAQPAMMLRWSKRAKPVYEEGKLVPWTSSR